jgi:hypothetical protein
MDYSLWQPTAVVSEITNQGSSRLFLKTLNFSSSTFSSVLTYRNLSAGAQSL